jgi:hypothetical protein
MERLWSAACTGRAVSTTIETEMADFSRLPQVPTRLRCPVCSDEHVWTASEAWLGGTDARRAAASRRVR